MYNEGQTSGAQLQGGVMGSLDISDAKKPHAQEIPEQIDRVGNALNETISLVQALHQKLASVMPPSAPEATDKVSGGVREPSTPLGSQLADFARMVQQNNTSIRYLLERIKL